MLQLLSKLRYHYRALRLEVINNQRHDGTNFSVPSQMIMLSAIPTVTVTNHRKEYAKLSPFSESRDYPV